MKKAYIFIFMLIFFSLFSPKFGRGTINSVTITHANPTILSNGLGYYLAGQTYNFQVRVVDPDATGWGDITLVRLVLDNGVDIQINPNGVNGTPYTHNGGNLDVAAGTVTYVGTYNDFTVTFITKFTWSTPEIAWLANRNITATATSISNTLSSTQIVSYGVSTTIRALNPAMTGEASDGMVNRLHQGFNFTADAIVYNVPGAALADEVNTRTPGEMTNSRARFDANSSANNDNTFPGISIAINGSELNAWYTFSAIAIVSRFRITMTTGAASVDTSNPINLYCNEVRVTNITFSGGGGINSAPTDYYRATTLPGTQITVDADIRGGGTPMVGNTNIVIRDSDNNDVTVTIPNGSTTGTAFAVIPAITFKHLTQKSYFAYNVTSGAYSSSAGFGQNNNNKALINQPAPERAIWWNNQLRPSRTGGPSDYTALLTGGAFTTWRNAPILSPKSTADSFTVYWNELQALPGNPNGDFSSYKIYYKKNSDSIWTIVDKNTAGFALLGTIGTTSATITGLAPLTKYDYQLSAYDVFGNEIIAAERPYNNPAGTCLNIPLLGDTYCAASTTSSSTTVTVTDGISTYDNNSFAGFPNPVTSHPLRKSAIKITATVITGGNVPDSVNLIFASNATDIAYSDPNTIPLCAPGNPQWGSAAGACPGGSGTDDNILNLPANTRYSLAFTKQSSNVWYVYIPSDHPLMTVGTSIRFIVETVYKGVSTYVDHTNPTLTPPGNWWSDEWRFYISSQPTFTPWPVRILNNVMDANNPIAYPAYYLTDDAYVTISVFDLKGRPVITLLDNQLRKGGQNIKEGGWDGSNKASRKIGVGIYYVRFYATRAIDGKVILNEFRKVVMAR